MNKDFYNKFKIEELTLYQSQYWIVSLRPQQPTIGSLVLSLKRDCQFFGDLEKEETKELADVLNLIEKVLKQAFNYDRINYLALMMVDFHVHYHVIPRYNGIREFNGKDYKDEKWPTPPDILINTMKEAEIKNLYNLLKKKFDGN